MPVAQIPSCAPSHEQWYRAAPSRAFAGKCASTRQRRRGGQRAKEPCLAASLTINLDSTIVATHGRAKHGAASGYTKVRGYHPQLATCAQTGQVLMRLRGGSVGATRGAASFLTETIGRVRNAGSTGQLTVRADSAFYSKTVIATTVNFDVRFSITARQDKRVRAPIDAIPHGGVAADPVLAVHPEVPGADVVETGFTAFAATGDPPARSGWSCAESADPRLAAGAVHDLGLARLGHRPGRERAGNSRRTTAGTPSWSRPSPNS